MAKKNLVIAAILFAVLSISCKWINSVRPTSKGPRIDLTTPATGLDVQVQLDNTQTATNKISNDGGSVSLTTADGSSFTLDVPANALEAETEIRMTAVKSLDGAPLANNTPTAVQLEPSGLFFKEMATLTIVPAKEIPAKEQIIFGYEGDGRDYHLAVVDPKSKEIKIKLMHFSGAGVGSGSDSAWAVTLQLQADRASARIAQELGELVQPERLKRLAGENSLSDNELDEKVKSLLDQFDDQVVLKQIAAAELDCKHAFKALEDLIFLGKLNQFFGASLPDDFAEKGRKLKEIADQCKGGAGEREGKSEGKSEVVGSYQIVGGLDDFQTNTAVCDIMKPFKLTGGGITMQLSGGLTGTYSYTGPFNANGTGNYTISLPDGIGKPGTMTGGGAGQITGDKVYTGTGTEKYTLTPIPPCK
ncbi:MAG: hypothetical protein DMF69_10850 [Acidobacteria bacterium]|nr:MAG: hypothetical protein DMF69_10850 [Acidobacteriota bacterium]